MERLSEIDLDILIEALDAWVEKDAAGELVCNLIGGLLAKDPEAREALVREREEAGRQRKYERDQRKEVATLLKATLIRMKRNLQEASARV